MPQHAIQEALSFAVLGVAVLLMGLFPALPAAVDAQTVALGTMLMFASGVLMFLTSPTAVSELHRLETAVREYRTSD